MDYEAKISHSTYMGATRIPSTIVASPQNLALKTLCVIGTEKMQYDVIMYGWGIHLEFFHETNFRELVVSVCS